MRVTTANHITRALRHPWCTLSFITRAVIFVLVNASLETQRFQLLATLAVVDAGLLWNLVNIVLSKDCWMKEIMAHKPKKGGAWMYFMVSMTRLQVPSVQFFQPKRVWKYSPCLITLYIWHLAQVPSEADRNQLTPGEQGSAGKPLNTNAMVMLSNTSGVLRHNVGW